MTTTASTREGEKKTSLTEEEEEEDGAMIVLVDGNKKDENKSERRRKRRLWKEEEEEEEEGGNATPAKTKETLKREEEEEEDSGTSSSSSSSSSSSEERRRHDAATERVVGACKTTTTTKKKKKKRKRTRWDVMPTGKQIVRGGGAAAAAAAAPQCTLRLEYWMRSEEMTVKKREHVAKLDERGGYYGVEDHIEKTVFQNDPNVKVILEENMFPYECPPGVSHWTLWSREDMTGEEIQNWVHEYLMKHRKDVVEWNYDMNDNCSVDVPHYHVFLRVEDVGYEMKARSKPGEISYSREERAKNEHSTCKRH